MLTDLLDVLDHKDYKNYEETGHKDYKNYEETELALKQRESLWINRLLVKT